MGGAKLINRKAIKWCMGASFESLAMVEGAEILSSDPLTRHIHIDRGSNILGVAHIDSVQKYHGTKITRDKIYSSTVDDRIGVYMMLYGLPALGIHCDVLLTDHEEVGGSTAQFYYPERAYKWMFQFDRADADVVCYQYETPKIKGALQECGFKVSDGIFSDISCMEFMGICGFNVGCGMHDYHEKNAYVEINELVYQASLFRYFWTFYGGTRFDWDPTEIEDNDWFWMDDMPADDDLSHQMCEFCGAWDYMSKLHELSDSLLCDGCLDWFTSMQGA